MRACLGIGLLACLAMLLGPRAWGDDPPAPASASATPPEPTAQPEGKLRPHPFLGAAYATETGPAFDLGFVLTSASEDVFFGKGLIVQVEAGTRAGRFSLGLGATDLRLYPAFAGALKATVLRTWKSTDLAPVHSTFVGPELELTLFYLRFGVGWVKQVDAPSGTQANSAWIFSAGTGF